jgi:acyl-CoA thioester hydrolase
LIDRPAHFPVQLEIPIAWGEQDAFGHLNNVAYLRYFESVRMHFLDQVGILRSHADQGIGVILASTTCNFLRPVHWPATLTVATTCTHVGNTSFTMAYRITDQLGDLVADGISVQVMFDYNAAKKVRVPDTVRTAIGDMCRL